MQWQGMYTAAGAGTHSYIICSSAFPSKQSSANSWCEEVRSSDMSVTGQIMTCAAQPQLASALISTGNHFLPTHHALARIIANHIRKLAVHCEDNQAALEGGSCLASMQLQSISPAHKDRGRCWGRLTPWPGGT